MGTRRRLLTTPRQQEGVDLGAGAHLLGRVMSSFESLICTAVDRLNFL